jgi:hypothetical protein
MQRDTSVVQAQQTSCNAGKSRTETSATACTEFDTQMQTRTKFSHTCIFTVRDRPDAPDGTAFTPSEIWPKQNVNAGKRRIYQLAGIARAPRNTRRCSLMQVKGVPLLVPYPMSRSEARQIAIFFGRKNDWGTRKTISIFFFKTRLSRVDLLFVVLKVFLVCFVVQPSVCEAGRFLNSSF